MKIIVQEAKRERQREVNRLFLGALSWGLCLVTIPATLICQLASFSCTFLTLPVH